MSNTFKLPPELVRIITENLSSNRAELHALTLVCKSFYWEAMRLLYRSMTDSDGTKHFKFLVTLRNRPQIADLVHTYHLPTTPNSKKRALWPVILRCMLLMINLKELAYTHLFAFPFTPFPQAKRGQKMPFQLETFIWDVDVPIYDVEHFYPAKLFQFLRTQPEIKFLLWKNTLRPGMTLAPNVLPKLKVLRVSWGQMATFLSGRSISDFFWRDQNKWGEYNYFNSDIVIETAIGVFKLKEFATLRAVSLPRVIWLDMPRSRAILQAREGMVHPNKIKVLELCSVYNTGEVNPNPLTCLSVRTQPVCSILDFVHHRLLPMSPKNYHYSTQFWSRR